MYSTFGCVIKHVLEPRFSFSMQKMKQSEKRELVILMKQKTIGPCKLLH